MRSIHKHWFGRAAQTIALLGFLISAGTAGAVPLYSVVKLDDAGNTTLGRDLNDRGQAVGQAAGFEGRARFRAVVWNPDGSVRDLGAGDNSSAWGINNAGQITGRSAQVDPFGQAFFYENGNFTGLGSLGGRQSGGVEINDNGLVAGFAETQFGSFRAVASRSGGAFQDLGSIAPVEPLGGAEAVAEGVNNAGQIVGFAHVGQRTGFCDRAGDCHAFLYENGQMRDLQNLGLTLGGDQSAALAINENGVIAGWAVNGDGDQRAILFDGGVTIDLGVLEGATSSTAWDVNDAGVAVGFYESASITGRAFVWEDGVMYNLNDLIDPTDPLFASIALVEAKAINESGQILVNGIGRGGIRSFLLTPVNEAPVPEPTAALLYAIGLGVVGARVRARRRNGL